MIERAGNAESKPYRSGQEELDLGVIEFGRLGRRGVQGRFDGGSMTSDAGVMLLSATDRKLGKGNCARQAAFTAWSSISASDSTRNGLVAS